MSTPEGAEPIELWDDLPYVQVMRGAPQARAAYEDLLAQARVEVLVFNRPPYSWSPEVVNHRVVDAVSRDLTTRVLYQEAQLVAPDASGFLAAHAAYHRAGVRGRMVSELPVKLAVFDQKKALVAMTGDDDGPSRYPAVLLVDDAGYARLQALAFEHLWELGRPIDDLIAGNGETEGE